LYRCPLLGRCNCRALLRVSTTGNIVQMETSNMHTSESHKDDCSKFLSHHQKAAVKQAVLMSPMAGPRALRRNIQLQPARICSSHGSLSSKGVQGPCDTSECRATVRLGPVMETTVRLPSTSMFWQHVAAGHPPIKCPHEKGVHYGT
jgi:hypothetical protein